jgi:hypothetical protein
VKFTTAYRFVKQKIIEVIKEVSKENLEKRERKPIDLTCDFNKKKL